MTIQVSISVKLLVAFERLNRRTHSRGTAFRTWHGPQRSGTEELERNILKSAFTPTGVHVGKPTGWTTGVMTANDKTLDPTPKDSNRVLIHCKGKL